MSYLIRKIGQKIETPGNFAIVPYTGTSPISNNEPGYMVNDGIFYSTFSYAHDSYIPLKNLKKAFSLGKDYVVYAEIGVSPNLQITGAQVVSSKVGAVAQEGQWKDFPDYYRIRPQDKTEVINKQTVVKEIKDGKFQEKAYVMLGQCVDEIPPYSKSYKVKSVSSLANKWSGYFIQYVETNIIMMQSMISGVPVLFPMPFFGGSGTSDPLWIENRSKK